MKKLTVEYDEQFDNCQEQEDDWVSSVIGTESDAIYDRRLLLRSLPTSVLSVTKYTVVMVWYDDCVHESHIWF